MITDFFVERIGAIVETNIFYTDKGNIVPFLLPEHWCMQYPPEDESNSEKILSSEDYNTINDMLQNTVQTERFLALSFTAENSFDCLIVFRPIFMDYMNSSFGTADDDINWILSEVDQDELLRVYERESSKEIYNEQE